MDVLIQPPLFPKKPRKETIKPLVCAFGTPWLDHFSAPVGNGQGCSHCERETWRHDTDVPGQP